LAEGKLWRRRGRERKERNKKDAVGKKRKRKRKRKRKEELGSCVSLSNNVDQVDSVISDA